MRDNSGTDSATIPATAQKGISAMTNRGVQSDRDFRLMALKFRLRDWLRPPDGILRAAGLRAGMTVLDFGCGPGGFSLAAARLVGPEGQVYALDRNPRALEYVRRAAARRRLGNVQPVAGDYVAGMPPASADLVLLYDVLHHLDETGGVLAQFHRVLKPEGLLSVSDHHLQEAAVLSAITGGGFFRLASRNRRTYEFEPVPVGGTAG